ncbi:MAG: ImmA/IrrE family metallo-endopeptidase, partial [bacterium]
KKFAGLIQWHSTCPVIILSSKYQQSARLAFDLAHELGHLALAHLNNGVLVDEDITFDNDCEEEEANQFATELLLGDCDNCLGDGKFKNAEKLSKYVQEHFIS